MNRNVSANLIINIEKTIYTAPEVLEFFRNHCHNTESNFEISLVEEKLMNAEVYSLGRIIAKVYGVGDQSSNGKGLFTGKIAENSEIKSLIDKMVSKNQ